MEYFRSSLSSVLGSAQSEVQPSPAETVERLLDRVQSSSFLEDRRDACRALKSLSRKYRVEVGAQGLETLTRVLDSQNDTETCSYVLETLRNVTSSEIYDEETSPNSGPLGEQFTEIFLKKSENVSAVIGMLEEYDFRVRLPAIQLLTNLLLNKPKEMQDIILVCPMGVSKLMDILSDSRDYVRNEALLLLAQLTKSNANIQKIVAFENGFDRLFDVLREEGYSDGGIVVYDCLQLMLNLLKNNASNQTFFREGSFIKRITPFFLTCQQLEAGNLTGWSTQKIQSVHCMLQVVRSLVSPSMALNVVSPAQKAMAACALLSELCQLLMANGVPVDILTETICCVGEIIRGCQSNQEAFVKVMVPSSPPRTALVVLLMSMVNEKQPITLRTAVLYCFECFLYKNDVGQGQIIQTLLPTSPESVPDITAGQLLCGGLFSTDSFSHWLSSVALSHALVGNTGNKEMLLRVQLATSVGAPPISLLQQCFNILQQGGKIQTRLGILILLSTWLAHCPAAVSQFVKLPNTVAFLTAQVGSNEHDEQEVLVQSLCAFLLGLCVHFNNNSNNNFSKETLCQVITKRIGIDTFVDKLTEITKHEVYSKASKHPKINVVHAQDVQLDHEFCRLFKELETSLIKAVAPSNSQKGGESPSESELKITTEYKEMIRELDGQVQHLRQRLAALESENIAAQSKIEELNGVIQHLQDQNALLKAQRNNNVIIDDPREVTSTNVDELAKELEYLQTENEKLRTQLENKSHVMNGEANPELVPKTVNNANILDSFQITPSMHEDVEVCSFFRPATNNSKLESELLSLMEQLKLMEQEKNSLVDDYEKRCKSCERENGILKEEVQRLKKDQEDTLILIADQDNVIKKYKIQLKSYGAQVSDEDDDDDDYLNDDLDDSDVHQLD